MLASDPRNPYSREISFLLTTCSTLVLFLSLISGFLTSPSAFLASMMVFCTLPAPSGGPLAPEPLPFEVVG